jgi:prephenate dehydratase
MSSAETGGRPRAGFLGPAGTFSEEALLSSATPDALEPVPLASIHDAVLALREGRVDLSIVPIENSLEGSIDVTLDLLAEQAATVQIVGETLLRVRHSLIAVADVPLAGITAVVSHPQVPGQCTRFLRGEMARAEVRPAASTAEAVRGVVAAGDPTVAALGTALAAEIYGGTVLREGVEDRADNETRFVWLARAGDGRTPPLRAAEGSLERRCSIVFWGPGAEHPGWLVRCLGEFAGREINLTKIESRPRRTGLGSYMFFADLDAGAEEPAVAGALEGLRDICEEVRVLGSYRAARPAARGEGGSGLDGRAGQAGP